MQMMVDSSKMKSITVMNLSSRYIYCVLHGFRAEGLVRVDYNELVEYSGMAIRTIKGCINDLIDNKYITRVAKGKYSINK